MAFGDRSSSRTRRRNDATASESVLYGAAWESAHRGYFSDPDVAEPLLASLLDVIESSSPDVVADLGGGTGFVLRLLGGRLGDAPLRLLNVDVSGEQLNHIQDPQIECHHSSIEKLNRLDLTSGEGVLLVCMRSLLHYFGREGLVGVLKHIRSLMEPGEYLVHQTATFANPGDEFAANELYRLMNTRKWYPNLGQLDSALLKADFRLVESRQGPVLTLTRDELQHRYGIDGKNMDTIADRMLECGCCTPGIYDHDGGDFKLHLHYQILVCTAV
jgi:SAM-dependent methyltransferase